jgi:HEAT repeat protein
MDISEKKNNVSSNVTTRRRSELFRAGLFFACGILAAAPPIAAKGPNKQAVQSKAWSVVREALTLDDSAVREQAVQSLEFVDNMQATNALLSSLDDESEYVRIWAARSLIKKGNPSGKQTLLRILMQHEPAAKNATGPLAALEKMKALARGRLRGEAAKTLGLFQDESLIPVLKEAQRDNDGRVRDGAAVALALMGDKSQAGIFANALKEEDHGVRLAALEALAAMKDGRYAEDVVPLLRDHEPDVRADALRALAGMKSLKLADLVVPMLNDDNGSVRETAAWTLGELGARNKIANLKASLSDPNSFVKIACAEALGKLGDNSGLGALEAALNANETDIRARAAAALGSLDDDATYVLAAKTLGDGNIRVRMGAAFSVLKSKA